MKLEPGDQSAGGGLAGDGRPPRVLLDVGAADAGTTLIVFAAIHGNEQSGLHTVGRLEAAASGGDLPLRGRLLCVSGNRKAIAANERFVDRDLNRRWGAPPTETSTAEDEEQRELIEVIDDAVAMARRAGQGVVLLDLHSTSGKTPAFCCLADAPRNLELGLSLGLPVILGLEETADGTLLGFYNDQGLPGVAVEGGQHEDPRTIERQEAAAMVMMASVGMLEPSAAAVQDARRALRAASKGRPTAVEIVHRHPVEPGDKFTMVPGFASFQEVKAGTVLAHDVRGAVRADVDARVLLPLYQGSGEDGFFLATDVSFARMNALRILRQVGADRVLGWLPGVNGVQGEDAFEIAAPPATAGLYRRVLGLFGYRRPRGDGVWGRRRQLQ